MCRAASKAALDADVGLYSNISAMDDVNEVREALGYRQINLFGGSGGTRSVQVYLRRHSTTARAAILKGVVPMDMENPIPHARSLEQAIGFAELIADGAFLAATCAEDLRFVTEADIRSATDGTFLGDYRVRRQLAACRVWGFGEEVGSDSQQPITVDVPVLLISGAVDPVTSAAGAERVAKALPRAWHIVFPNQSHDSVNRPCEERLRADFITALGGRASTPPVLPKPADRLSSSSRGGPDHVGALRLAT